MADWSKILVEAALAGARNADRKSVLVRVELWAAALVCTGVSAIFVTVAIFVWLTQRLGMIEAASILAGFFLVLALGLVAVARWQKKPSQSKSGPDPALLVIAALDGFLHPEKAGSRADADKAPTFKRRD